ncbi:MAG: tetratricopeptide repeat protein [Vallitaleaceae bacterium]|nr:tetratricopeptide repeat protein [Vallitaleaceae bacterium]
MKDMTLGQKIREIRLHLQMTQKELAGDFITRNMLSQIENDQATPSMKTMEYLAKQLGKSVGYFMDENHKDLSLSNIIVELMALNEAKDYVASVKLIEQQSIHNPIVMRSKMMMDLYMNSYMYLGNQYMTEGDNEKAKAAYEKILKYENELLLESDIYLYKVYAQLAEVCGYLLDIELAKTYHKKSKDLVNKILASREVQTMYLKLIEADYDGIIEDSNKVDVIDYDNYSLARYNRVLGSAFLNKGEYEKAIVYLEKAIEIYSDETCYTIVSMIYEELSKCYFELGDYKKAYDFLQKAQSKKISH